MIGVSAARFPPPSYNNKSMNKNDSQSICRFELGTLFFIINYQSLSCFIYFYLVCVSFHNFCFASIDLGVASGIAPCGRPLSNAKMFIRIDCELFSLLLISQG